MSLSFLALDCQGNDTFRSKGCPGVLYRTRSDRALGASCRTSAIMGGV